MNEDLQALLRQFEREGEQHRRWVERFRAEMDFARRLTGAHPDRAGEWAPLLERAAQRVLEGLRGGTRLEDAVTAAEQDLAPLAAAAREYTIYCCGHAHIDMNWMWTWPETVAVTHDTFSTMDQLMDEFPEFHFSQSQASVYELTRQYAPEQFARLRQRVQEGRWEVTASQWVEGDKNLASGEILCRHLLLTRRWFQEHLGLSPEQVRIDWECDTFGHCWTLPGILTRGGVTRYYHHRSSGPQLAGVSSGQQSQLYWWQGKDGSRVLAYDDSPNGYNCEIAPNMTRYLFDMERNTGLKKLLWIYGVGDHGGGPTRRHLRAAQEMAQWPVYPVVKLTTTDDFYSACEAEIAARNLQLPVINEELNFVFEGCYTSESRIKFANRRGECDLADTEAVAVLAGGLCGREYPADHLRECWQRAMFLQFHDILPGSGVKETIEHAMGLFQENLARTGSIRTQALRDLAARVDTSALAPTEDATGADMGLGGGAGNGAWWGGVTTLGAGAAGSDPFLVFNPAPFRRDELVRLKIWDRDLPDLVSVRDAGGGRVAGQIVERGDYWGHRFAVVAFPARQLPASGYRAYTVEAGSADSPAAPCYFRETGRPVYGLGYAHAQYTNPVLIGNEHLEVAVSATAGGIISILDRASGIEFVEEGMVLGALDRELEAPHGMTAWMLGPIIDSAQPLANGTVEALQRGPNEAAVRLRGRHGQSDYSLVVSLAAGSRQINFDLDVNWLERGDPGTGIPVLRASFPLAVTEGQANFEIACGTIERPADGEESPALNWADLSGESLAKPGATVGAALLNDCKYGHQLSDDELRLTLIRSSYDPDPLPEIGRHNIRYALVPHVGDFAENAGDIVRQGYAFNHAVIPVGTTVHSGELPAEISGLEVLTPNVMLSGVKQAEDGEGLIVRLYEFAGEETQAEVRLHESLVGTEASAIETDLLERPLEQSTATLAEGALNVTIPANGIATVRLG